MYTTLLFKPRWYARKGVFEEMKAVISQIGKLADKRPERIDGYLAERPDAMPNIIRVWAPCGCCWTYMNANASVITQCESDEDHNFDYVQAEAAIQALRAAEENECRSLVVVTPSAAVPIETAETKTDEQPG